MFEDQNTLQHGTLTSCSGTLTSTPITAFARLSCQRDCARGAEAGHSVFLPPSQGGYFVFFGCHFKCITLIVWVHVKAMYSARVNFFLMPQKHQRSLFQRNK